MPSVVLQQVTSRFARSNAGKTLEKPIALKYLQKFLPSDELQELEAVCTEGNVYVWGAKAERVHQFEKIPFRQSLVLFRHDASVYKCGVIDLWILNPQLAEYLSPCVRLVVASKFNFRFGGSNGITLFGSIY